MRTVLIIDGSQVQLDLVPETKEEERVLSAFAPGTTLRVGQAKGYAPCRGGYLRPFGDDSKAVSFTYLTTVSRDENRDQIAPS